MGGGLMQIVAYGAQDVYLTGNPQITFFKMIYRRYTNFSIESIEQPFNGNVDFGRTLSATISRNGDLMYKTYLQVTLPEIECKGLGVLDNILLPFPALNIIEQTSIKVLYLLSL